MKFRKLRRILALIAGPILLCALSGYASAQIIDDITVHTDANGEIGAVIKFAVPIQYIRHFPQGKSSSTSIFFNILSSVPMDEWQDFETRRTPPSDIVQEITVSTRDLGTGPKVQIKFFRPAEFSVRMGDNNQTLLVHIKPVLLQQKNEEKPAAEAVGGTTKPLAAVPLVAQTIAKTRVPPVSVPPVTVPPVTVPPVTVPPVTVQPISAPVASATSAKPDRVTLPKATVSAVPPKPTDATIMPAATSSATVPVISTITAEPSVTPVADGVVDNIAVHTDAKGDIDAELKFTVPIRYLRNFPQGKSAFTSIYFNTPGPSSDKWKNYESHTTVPSDLIQDIMVTTRDRGTGPKVLIKFSRPAEFVVTMAKNEKTLLIHIKPGVGQQKNEGKPAAGESGAAIISLAALPLVLPSLAKAPSVVTPTVGVAAPPVLMAPASVAPKVQAPVVAPPVVAPPVAAPPAAAAPVAAAPVAAPPVAAPPVAPSGDVTAPKVVLTSSPLKPVHISLGGKDGLPIFPEIDQVAPQANVSPTEKPTLADQIMKANNQAAELMEKAGRAVLAGQTFVAIESFNNVLNLPPNKYSQDAQLWIGIARERSGQTSKAILEFDAYLKLYPNGKSAAWVTDRLNRLKLSQPALFVASANPTGAPARIQNTAYNFTEFGSVSMYYYTGASQTNTTSTVGTTQTQVPTSFSSTDQKSLMTNVNMMARAYNNEYDNRLVFQDFYAANYIKGQTNSNRLGAAYYEMRDRIFDYSVKIGRQSGFGGGVMGRFDGVSAGYGFKPGWRVNVVTGQLSDFSIDSKPTFGGISLDYGTRSPLGGSVYFINQNVSGITDRRAVGGNVRYFEQRFNVMAMMDYDIQFKALNMITLQGTANGVGNGATDYNFLLDHRRSPTLDIRNAVSGTTSTIASLIQDGRSMNDLIQLANQRTTSSNMAQVGMTNHLNEKWIAGTDFTISRTGGLQRSGGDTSYLCSDPINQNVIWKEGCIDAGPSSSGWTISERMTGMGVIRPGDITNFSLSYSKSKQAVQQVASESFQVSNHTDLNEKWTLDTACRLSFQSDNTGGKSYDLSPSVRANYKLRRNLSTDGQFGLDWNKNSSSSMQTSSRSFREFVSIGGRYDF